MLKYNPKMGYLTAAPPRDLTDEDIKRIEEQEGLTKQDLIDSGVYTEIKTKGGHSK